MKNNLPDLIRSFPGYKTLRQLAAPIRKKQKFKTDLNLFIKDLNATQRSLPLNRAECKAYLDDATPDTGFDPHYVYHCAIAARLLAKLHPSHHLDISSSLYFSTIISAFIPTTFGDYRPATLHLPNLATKRLDLCHLDIPSNSIESASCMHVLEHIGLGRYGDPIDANGDLKAMSELCRIIKPGGHLIIVVPVGQPKIIFNAHRIYNYEQIMLQFPQFTIKDFALIPDNASHTGFITNATPAQVLQQQYGCGVFFLQKATI
jgi:SAM-dependent methyltransferase